MSKKSTLNRYLLGTARIVYLFGTVAVVVAALAILGGH